MAGLFLVALATLHMWSSEQSATVAIHGSLTQIIDYPGSLTGPVTLKIEPKIDVPTNVSIGEAFPITASLAVVDAFFTLYPDKEYPASQQQLIDEARMEFADRITMQLALGGADVEPNTPQTAGEELSASWSISVDNAGTHAGFLKTQLTPTRNDRPDSDDLALKLPANRWEAQLVSDAPILIHVAGSKPTFEKSVALIGLCLGVILAISNILTFFWQWSDRRRKRLDENRRIIIPNKEA